MAPGYIIVWHPPASCGRHICTEFNPSTGQGDIPISSTGCTCFLIDGSVEGQYVTLLWDIEGYQWPSLDYFLALDSRKKSNQAIINNPGLYGLGGVGDVTVIVVGNGDGDLSLKSWTRLFAVNIELIPLEKAWIQLISLQVWVNIGLNSLTMVR